MVNDKTVRKIHRNTGNMVLEKNAEDIIEWSETKTHAYVHLCACLNLCKHVCMHIDTLTITDTCLTLVVAA